MPQTRPSPRRVSQRERSKRSSGLNARRARPRDSAPGQRLEQALEGAEALTRDEGQDVRTHRPVLEGRHARFDRLATDLRVGHHGDGVAHLGPADEPREGEAPASASRYTTRYAACARGIVARVSGRALRSRHSASEPRPTPRHTWPFRSIVPPAPSEVKATSASGASTAAQVSSAGANTRSWPARPWRIVSR